MRIVILHYAAPPVIGGVERVIYHHATILAEDGCDVHVVAGRGEPFAPDVTFHRVELVDSRHPEILAIKAELDAGRVPVPDFEALVGRILDALRAIVSDDDVVIAHNVLSLHKNLPLTAALHRLTQGGNGPSLIAWHHDLAWKSARYLTEMHDGYPWDLLRQPWPHVRHVTVSEARRHDVAKLFGLPLEAIAVVPGGVDTFALLGISPAFQGLLRQIGIPDADPVLLLPARITRRKNIEFALHVTAALREAYYPQAALIVTGPPGPHNPENQRYFAELKQMRSALGLTDSVHFLADLIEGGPDDDMMRGLYRLADALILPSYEEGFGLPVLEAAIARLPIFCSDIPPFRELAGEQATYFSLQADPGEAADAVYRVLRGDRVAVLRRRVLNHYDWYLIVHRYVKPLLNYE